MTTYAVCLVAGTTVLKQSKYGAPAKKVQTVAVLGAGLMGAGENRHPYSGTIERPRGYSGVAIVIHRYYAY